MSSNLLSNRLTYAVCAALLACLLWGATAQAAKVDTEPPTIIHNLLDRAYADANLLIRAQVADVTLVDEVLLFFRPPGATSFYSMSMIPINGEYRAVIPAEYLVQGVLEYYIQAQDAIGNSCYYPSQGYQPAPQELVVVQDTTVPQIVLLQPQRSTPRAGYTLFVLLHDEAGNLDPGTIRLYYNDVDVTARANISGYTIMYRVPAAATTFQTRVRVTATDLAGNRTDRTFQLWQEAAWSGELLLAGNSAQWSGSQLAFTSTWGPLDFAVRLRPHSIDGQAQSEWRLEYDARLMRWALGHVATQVTPVIGPLPHRGSDLTLRLGPISLQTVYGYQQKNQAYARQIVAVKPALDTRYLDMSLAVVKIKDYLQANQPITTTQPILNYVIDAQWGLAAFAERIGVHAKASVSLYHDNAQGDLWPVLDEVDARAIAEGDDALAEVLITLINYLKTVPPHVRDYFELPDVRYGLPKVDLGGQVDAWLPLPWSQLQATAYYYGRSFQTISDTVRSNTEGITASYHTNRLLNRLQLSGKYEYRLDNVASLLDMLTHNKLVDRTATNHYEGQASLGPAGGLNLNLSVAYEESGPLAADIEQINVAYQLELQNLGFQISTAQVTLDGLVKLHDDTCKANPLADRQVLTYQVRSKVEQGAFTYSLSYGQQREESILGVRMSPPSIAGSIRLNLADIAIFGQWPKAFMLQLTGSRNLPVSVLEDKTEQPYFAKLNLDTELRLLENVRFTAGWQRGFNPDVAPQNKWYTALQWRF